MRNGALVPKSCTLSALHQTRGHSHSSPLNYNPIYSLITFLTILLLPTHQTLCAVLGRGTLHYHLQGRTESFFPSQGVMGNSSLPELPFLFLYAFEYCAST